MGQVSVQLFSLFDLTELSITPGGAAYCNQSGAVQIGDTLDISVLDNSISCNGGAAAKLKITAKEGSSLICILPELTRSFPGVIEISQKNGYLQVINTLPLEDYVSRCLASESPSDAPIEAQKALAVVIRTFAVSGDHHPESPALLCDGTHCQAYFGDEKLSKFTLEATEKTRGVLLFYNGRPAQVAFTACCGGITRSPEWIWGSIKQDNSQPSILAAPELSSVQDPWCAMSEYSNWRVEFDEERTSCLFDSLSCDNIEGVQIIERAPDNRAAAINVLHSTGVKQLSGREFWERAVAALGWGSIPAIPDSIEIADGRITLAGRGFGHCVGLCQYGATAQANAGLDYKEILEFYFPSCEILKR